MRTFRTWGTTPELLTLTEQLIQHGAQESADPELILLGASDASEASELLGQIPAPLRGRAVIVGVDELLSFSTKPKAGSLAELLETSQPLGVLRPRAVAEWKAIGFVGPKHLAIAADSICMKGHETESYAAWMTRGDEDAGAFLLRLISVLES